MENNFGSTVAAYSMESTKSFSNNEHLQDEVQKYLNPFGIEKTSKSFTILLLDPRIIDNIPANVDIMQPFQSGLYPKFKKAIFFVGTVKRPNIHPHLKEAQHLWQENERESPIPIIQHILDIWSENYGVITLKVIETSLLKESTTYQTALIDVIGPSNLKNQGVVQYHDDMAGWSEQMRRELGPCLLSDAFVIYFNSRQLQLRKTFIHTHLNEALGLWKENKANLKNLKNQHTSEIYKVFHNIYSIYL